MWYFCSVLQHEVLSNFFRPEFELLIFHLTHITDWDGEKHKQ